MRDKGKQRGARATLSGGLNLSEKILLSRKDAADAMSVSLRKLDYLIAEGKIQGVVKIGKRTLIGRAALEKFARNPGASNLENGAERQ